MSFNVILLVTVAALAALVPFVGCYMFERGYNMGVREYNSTHKDDQKSFFEDRKPASAPKPDAKMQMYADILENIDNYDGTAAGQKDIKVV